MLGQEQEKTKRLTCLKDPASDWLSVWFNKAKTYFPITLYLPRPEKIVAIGFADFIRSRFFVREKSHHIQAIIVGNIRSSDVKLFIIIWQIVLCMIV